MLRLNAIQRMGASALGIDSNTTNVKVKRLLWYADNTPATNSNTTNVKVKQSLSRIFGVEYINSNTTNVKVKPIS